MISNNNNNYTGNNQSRKRKSIRSIFLNRNTNGTTTTTANLPNSIFDSSCWIRILTTPSRAVVFFLVLVIIVILYNPFSKSNNKTSNRWIIKNSLSTNNTSSVDIELLQPRAYPKWPIETKPLPCYPEEKSWMGKYYKLYEGWGRPGNDGILFVKTYKTGSSTWVGVTLRIARNLGQRLLSSQTKSTKKSTKSTVTSPSSCKVRYLHGNARNLFKKRVADKSFLFTVLRNPTDRVISLFFHFAVSRRKVEPTDKNFIHFLNTYPLVSADQYIQQLYLPSLFDRYSINPIEAIQTIIEEYNFIAVTERTDESAVALMMILNLTIPDILYVTGSKGHGSFDDGEAWYGLQGCVYIVPKFISSGMKQYFASAEWQDRIYYDTILYQIANKSLDMTIDKVGKDEFQTNLQRYRTAKKLIQTECSNSTVFPCDDGGNYHSNTDCFWTDSGCGTNCIDRIAQEQNW